MLLPLAVLLAVFGAYWWRTRPPLVELATTRLGPAVEAVYATGTVEPVTWARIGPAVRGRLAQLFVAEGQRVQPGQPLARLDDAIARAELAELEVRAGFLAGEAARARALRRGDTVSVAQQDRAESDARAAEAALHAAQRRLEDLTIKAPLAGVVLRRDGEVGEIVDTNAALFWIGEPSPLRITADVDEEDIPRVRTGQRALIKADAFAGQTLEGTVEQITPKGDPVQKTYRVRIALPPTTPLLIGMTTETNIVLREEARAVLAPASAVRDGAVFTIEQGRARRQPVRLGVQGPAMVELREGIGAGVMVIANPPAGLADGAAVRVRTPAATGAAAAPAPATGR